MFVDSSFKTDTETQDPCLSLLGEKKKQTKKTPWSKKVHKGWVVNNSEYQSQALEFSCLLSAH